MAPMPERLSLSAAFAVRIPEKLMAANAERRPTFSACSNQRLDEGRGLTASLAPDDVVSGTQKRAQVQPVRIARDGHR